MDRTEVTVAAYSKCVAAGACTLAATETSGHGATDATIAKLGPICNGDKPDRQQHAINCVDWAQASAYCAWSKGRLPTRVEWEMAATGGDGRKYPWGNEPPDVTRSNACDTSCATLFERTLGKRPKPMYEADDTFEAVAPVGRFPRGATPSGLLDMTGNVGEWLDEWYEAGKRRQFAGGSWDMSDPESLAIKHLGVDDPAVKSVLIGFRCVY